MKAAKLVIALWLCVAAAGTAWAGTDGTWLVYLYSRNWSAPQCWHLGIIADGSDATAYFTDNIWNPCDVTVDTNRTIGYLVFSDGGVNGNGYSLDGNTLTLQTSSETPAITTITNAYFGNCLAGNQGLVKQGAAVLCLKTSNTYSGSTIVNAGSIELRDDEALGATGAANGTTVRNGASVYFNNAQHVYESFTITGAGGGGALRGRCGNLYGAITLDGNATIKNLAFTNLRGGVSLGSAVLTIITDDSYGATRFCTPITGTGGIRIAGAGEAYIEAANSFSGPTVIDGYLSLVHTGAVVNSTVTLASREPVLPDTALLQFGGLAGSAGFNLRQHGALTLTVGSNDQDTTYSGALSGSGCKLTKTGSGTLTLGGTNTYSGGTELQAGVVSISKEANLGNTAGRLAFNGGTLRVTGAGFASTARPVTVDAAGSGIDVADSSGVFSINQPISGAAPLAKLGPGTFAPAGDNSGFSGGFRVDAGTLSISADTNLGDPAAGLTLNGGTLRITGAGLISTARPVTLGAGGGTIDTVDGGCQFQLDSALSGANDLAKLGYGSLLLTADNSAYSGTIHVNKGYLYANAGNALGSAAVKIDDGYLILGTALPSCASLVVGQSGIGHVNQGPDVEQFTVAGTLTMGEQAGSKGYYNLYAGSLHVQGNAHLGASGTATFNHQSYQLVQVDGSLRLGEETGSQGTYTLGNSGELQVDGGWLVVGRYGRGTFNQNNGDVTAADKLYIAEAGGGTGDYNLANGSLSADELHVGIHGNGTFHQTGGASTITALTCIGEAGDGTGVFEVDGGSAQAGSIFVGGGSSAAGGTGTLKIGSGATLTAHRCRIWNNGTVSGSGLLELTGSSTCVDNDGTVAPGGSPGVLTIDGDYQQHSGGKLAIELGGLARGSQHDALVIHNPDPIDETTLGSSFGGTLKVTLIGGFSPQAGDTFDILDWDHASTGSFATLDLPALAGGLAWDVSSLYTTGALGVAQIVVSNALATDNGDGTLTVTWDSNVATLGQVNYGPVSLVGATPSTASEPGIGTSHSVTFGIAAGTNYKLVIVNNEVVGPTLYAPSPWPIPCDANLDCRVNILDLIFTRNRLNQDPATGDNWQADVNEDTQVNILDLIYVRNRLNTACP